MESRWGLGGGSVGSSRGSERRVFASVEPRCMHHVGFGGLGVDLGVDLGAEGGVGYLVGSWWGLCWCLGGRRGRRQGRKGGPLHFHRPTSRNGSCAVRRKFCALLLGGVHRSRTRNTRSAWDENEKDDFGVSGEKFELNVRVKILTQKLTRPFFSRLRHAELHRNAVSTQPLKIRTAGRSVWCMI